MNFVKSSGRVEKVSLVHDPKAQNHIVFDLHHPMWTTFDRIGIDRGKYKLHLTQMEMFGDFTYYYCRVHRTVETNAFQHKSKESTEKIYQRYFKTINRTDGEIFTPFLRFVTTDFTTRVSLFFKRVFEY